MGYGWLRSIVGSLHNNGTDYSRDFLIFIPLFISFFVKLKDNSFLNNKFNLYQLNSYLYPQLIYFKFENKKNQIKVMALRPNIIPRKRYANFLPIKAVSGSSFTLINLLII